MGFKKYGIVYVLLVISLLGFVAISLFPNTPIFTLNSFPWFYLWTNLGVWLLDSWGMYSDDFIGLQNSYIAGIPFFKYHLVSNLVIISSGFIFVEIANYFINNLGRIFRWYEPQIIHAK